MSDPPDNGADSLRDLRAKLLRKSLRYRRLKGREYLSLMDLLGAEDCLQAHRHMGLDKYL